jgi:hypothetical protein
LERRLKACQCDKDNGHRLTGHHRTTSSVSQGQTMHMMHRNNGAAFLLLRIDSETVRAIARCRASLNMPCFSCFPGPRFLARSDCYHVSCASIYDRSQLYINCTCALMRRVALLFPHHPRSYYPPLDSSLPSLCLMLILLPHRPTSNQFSIVP